MCILFCSGWTGGDAWFGSIDSAVELKRRLNVFCTFIIKHQQNLFPIEVLRAILRARYPKRAAGHWVVMKATISEVDLYIMAYAWSNKGIAFTVSTCGTTVQHERNYMSNYEMSLAIVPRRSSPAQQFLTCSTSFYHSLTSITRQDRAILHWRDAG